MYMKANNMKLKLIIITHSVTSREDYRTIWRNVRGGSCCLLLPLWNLLQWLRSPVGSTRDLWLHYLSFCTVFFKVAKISGNFLFPLLLLTLINQQNRNVNMTVMMISCSLYHSYFIFQDHSPAYKLRSNLSHFHPRFHFSLSSPLFSLYLCLSFSYTPKVQLSSEGKWRHHRLH